jgi:alpha-glucosidase (family GH31 glycosyl hydrolase)
VFAYGRDYRAALRALYALTGPTPLLPRYALGNWWSRYHPYTADEYVDLMDRFRAERLPLSVAVIDIAWHPVDVDPKYGSGWTGYTWDTELFPDPKQFLADLHERDLAVSLNVHPAEGVHAHEASYAAIAERMGIDPDTEMPVNFDPTDEAFVEAYLEELHHPLEDEGVDFWWLDWQQGGVTKVPGLDPLWLLNHVHFLDSGRDGKRPLTFSRYAGIGNHRYPIGFSGDTHITWESLDFQPYFTSTASNAGYGWWSHDIGGHFKGYKDDELTTRWVQYGVFSPVMRLHAGLNPFNTKEPWRFSGQAETVMKDFLRLRHQLLPFLATMNVRAHADGEPLVQPMYYDHPDEPAAYACRNEFMFGPDLLVAPITTPADRETGLGRVRAWLPEGTWTDVFTGLTYTGGRTVYLHRDLTSIPVLARAGAIVPMVPQEHLGNGADLPAEVEVRVYAGADGDFTLVEDRDDERWARTRLTWDDAAAKLTVHDVEGDADTLPDDRTYRVVVVQPSGDVDDRLFTLLDRAQMGYDLKATIFRTIHESGSPAAAALALQGLDLSPVLLGALSELLLAR